eukprot:SAG22_NODE_277_length_13166_cov_134.125277_6_plen_303_part_00
MPVLPPPPPPLPLAIWPAYSRRTGSSKRHTARDDRQTDRSPQGDRLELGGGDVLLPGQVREPPGRLDQQLGRLGQLGPAVRTGLRLISSWRADSSSTTPRRPGQTGTEPPYRGGRTGGRTGLPAARRRPVLPPRRPSWSGERRRLVRWGVRPCSPMRCLSCELAVKNKLHTEASFGQPGASSSSVPAGPAARAGALSCSACCKQLQPRLEFWFWLCTRKSGTRCPAAAKFKLATAHKHYVPNIPKTSCKLGAQFGRTQTICNYGFNYELKSIAAASPYTREEQIQIQPVKFRIWFGRRLFSD